MDITMNSVNEIIFSPEVVFTSALSIFVAASTLALLIFV